MAAAPDLERHLDQLGERHRVAFAASCCERILPAYAAFSRDDNWGDAQLLREALGRVWASVSGAPVNERDERELTERCEQQIHHLDDPFRSVFTAPAQNAAIAVLRAVQCAAHGDLALADEIGDFALDAVEAYVDATQGEGSVFDAELVTSSRLYKDEIGHQLEDVATLAEHRVLESNVVEQLRQRSRTTGFAAIVPTARH
jgi:uncharacterized protein YjaG (DUF416 family)